MCRYLITSDFVVIKLHLNSTRIESSQLILNGSSSKFCSQQATRKGSPWAKPGTAGFYLLPSFWSKAHIVAGGAGEAGQADPGAGEREGGAGVAPAGERRSDQGDQKLSIMSEKKVSSANQGDVELVIVSQKKTPRCWRMRTWLLQLCLETSRNNFHRFYKVKTKIKLVSGKAFCQKQSEHWNTSITGRQQTSINCHQLCHLVYCLCEGTRKVCSDTTKPHNFYLVLLHLTQGNSKFSWLFNQMVSGNI